MQVLNFNVKAALKLLAKCFKNETILYVQQSQTFSLFFITCFILAIKTEVKFKFFHLIGLFVFCDFCLF